MHVSQMCQLIRCDRQLSGYLAHWMSGHVLNAGEKGIEDLVTT